MTINGTGTGVNGGPLKQGSFDIFSSIKLKDPNMPFWTSMKKNHRQARAPNRSCTVHWLRNRTRHQTFL